MKTTVTSFILALTLAVGAFAAESKTPEEQARDLERGAEFALVNAGQFPEGSVGRAYFTGRAEAFLQAADVIRATAPKTAPASVQPKAATVNRSVRNGKAGK